MNGEMSAEVQSSTLKASVGDCGDDPNEKFSLNMLMVSASATQADKYRDW